MEWEKHKELYASTNMSKLLFMAVNKWKDYHPTYSETKSKPDKQTKLTLINCDEL